MRVTQFTRDALALLRAYRSVGRRPGFMGIYEVAIRSALATRRKRAH